MWNSLRGLGEAKTRSTLHGFIKPPRVPLLISPEMPRRLSGLEQSLLVNGHGQEAVFFNLQRAKRREVRGSIQIAPKMGLKCLLEKDT